MRPRLPRTTLLGALLVAALAPLSGCVTSRPHAPMHTAADLAHLRFLEGRWKGTGPDGKPFYEAYDFVDAETFRSRRYPDERFATPTDGSSVVLEAGEIISRWGEYRWRATEVTPQQVCFAPVNAPSAFCWRRAGDSSVEVVQRWKDERGAEQSYTLLLQRLP